MKIKKHGKTYNKQEEKKERFECENCGCEFNADEDEYYVDLGGANYNNSTITTTITLSMTTKDYLVCSCPECHKIVKKIRDREIPINPVINATHTSLGSTTTVQLNNNEPVSVVLDGKTVDSGWPYEDSLTEALLMK